MKSILKVLALASALAPTGLMANEITVKFKVADYYSHKPITDWSRGWLAMDINATSLTDGSIKVLPALDDRGSFTDTMVFPEPGRYEFKGPGNICSLAEDTIEINKNIVEIVLFAGCE